MRWAAKKKPPPRASAPDFVRADLFLVEHGYAKTRTEAQEAIAAGNVTADGRPVIKASQPLNETSRVKYKRAAYVRFARRAEARGGAGPF